VPEAGTRRSVFIQGQRRQAGAAASSSTR